MVLACVLLATFSVVRAELPAPSHFYGQVKINNENVPDGTEVSAWIAGVMYATANTSTHEGHSVYALDVPGDDPSTLGVVEGGVEGDTIVFKISDLELEAEQTGTWISGADVNLDLSVMVVTVTADPQTKVYGEPDPELTYTYAPEDPGIIFEGALERDAGEDVGEYAITQGDLSAEGYAIVFISDDLAITPKPITITAEPKSKIYRTVDPPLTYTRSTDLILGDVMSGGLARISGENVGQYEIRQGTLGINDGNQGKNYAITYQEAMLTIEPRTITVTADDKEKVLGQVDPPLTYQITSGELMPPDVITGSLARVGGEGVGTYEILIGSLAIDDDNGGKNYHLTFEEGIFTINPSTITHVDVTDIQEPVAGASPDILATITAIPGAGIAASTAEVMWNPDDDIFEEHTLYTASVTLIAAGGYAFSTSTTATVNGEEAIVLLNPDGTLTVSYEFMTVVEPSCLEVQPANLVQTQQADDSKEKILTLTNTCDVEVNFDVFETIIMLSEGFEAILMPPEEWQIRQLNDVHTWIRVPNPVDQGQYAAWVRWDIENPSDEWLISPIMDTTAVTDLVLSFRAYTKTDYPGASVKVWVLDADGNRLTVEPLWDLIRDEQWSKSTYRSVMVDLGQFDGYGEIRIGWQYVGQGGESFGLDTIYINSRAEIPWLELPFTSDSIAPSKSKEIVITFDSTGLEIGTYQALLSIINFPNPTIHIPVRLWVIGEGYFFYLPLIFR